MTDRSQTEPNQTAQPAGPTDAAPTAHAPAEPGPASGRSGATCCSMAAARPYLSAAAVAGGATLAMGIVLGLLLPVWLGIGLAAGAGVTIGVLAGAMLSGSTPGRDGTPAGADDETARRLVALEAALEDSRQQQAQMRTELDALLAPPEPKPAPSEEDLWFEQAYPDPDVELNMPEAQEPPVAPDLDEHWSRAAFPDPDS